MEERTGRVGCTAPRGSYVGKPLLGQHARGNEGSANSEQRWRPVKRRQHLATEWYPRREQQRRRWTLPARPIGPLQCPRGQHNSAVRVERRDVGLVSAGGCRVHVGHNAQLGHDAAAHVASHVDVERPRLPSYTHAVTSGRARASYSRSCATCSAHDIASSQRTTGRRMRFSSARCAQRGDGFGCSPSIRGVPSRQCS